MTQKHSISREEIKKYIFRELKPHERERVEQELFEDNDFLYKLLEVENDLVDLYVLEKLEGDDLARFEKSLQTSPEMREKVATARALQHYIAEEKQRESAWEKSIAASATEIPLWKRVTAFIGVSPSVIQYAVAGLFILMTTGIIFLLVEQRRVNQELARLHENRSKIEEPQPEKTLQEQFQAVQEELKAAQEREAELKRQIESQQGEATTLHEQLERAVSEREKAERESEKLRREQLSPANPQTSVIARIYLEQTSYGKRGGSAEELIRRDARSLVITLDLGLDVALKEPLSVEINGRREATDVQLNRLSPGITLASINIAPQRVNNGTNKIVLKDADNRELGIYELNVKKR